VAGTRTGCERLLGAEREESVAFETASCISEPHLSQPELDERGDAGGKFASVLIRGRQTSASNQLASLAVPEPRREPEPQPTHESPRALAEVVESPFRVRASGTRLTSFFTQAQQVPPLPELALSFRLGRLFDLQPPGSGKIDEVGARKPVADTGVLGVSTRLLGLLRERRPLSKPSFQ
jgi:hypothetical protein